MILERVGRRMIIHKEKGESKENLRGLSRMMPRDILTDVW